MSNLIPPLQDLILKLTTMHFHPDVLLVSQIHCVLTWSHHLPSQPPKTSSTITTLILHLFCITISQRPKWEVYAPHLIIHNHRSLSYQFNLQILQILPPFSISTLVASTRFSFLTLRTWRCAESSLCYVLSTSLPHTASLINFLRWNSSQYSCA